MAQRMGGPAGAADDTSRTSDGITPDSSCSSECSSPAPCAHGAGCRAYCCFEPHTPTVEESFDSCCREIDELCAQCTWEVPAPECAACPEDECCDEPPSCGTTCAPDPDGGYCHWGSDCGFTFASPGDLDEHLRSSHIALAHPHPRPAPEPTPAPAYDMSFVDNLLCHWSGCNVATGELDALLDHVKHEHMETAPAAADAALCRWDSCTGAFTDPRLLELHLLEQHMTPLTAGAAPAGAAAPFMCEWDGCSFAAATGESMVAHVVGDHLPRPLPRDHAHREAGSALTGVDGQEHHQCLWVIDDHETPCALCFASAHELSQHILSAHIPTRRSTYNCRWLTCPRRPRPGDYLAESTHSHEHSHGALSHTHPHTHTDAHDHHAGHDRRRMHHHHDVHVVGKSFRQRQKLARHLQVHTRDKPFTCGLCGHSFAEKAVLEQHMRIHSGDKPFKCKVCGRGFAASTALSVHVRTHTGAKPLKCKYPGCGKAFSESSNLAKHVRTHERDRRFVCQTCSRGFVRNDQLLRHMRTHLRKADAALGLGAGLAAARP
ncbi:uncharacterized protein V1510DRAFT_405017 [Dipodascopsis tothii]|uniref:uncharacterized protein n=1 Tax=Dipodascopsis tothii TaxID=44089 RepID=UPI0034CD5BF7